MLPTGTAKLCIAGRRFRERQDFAAIQKPFWITRKFTVSGSSPTNTTASP